MAAEPKTDPTEAEPLKRMSFGDHLEELRRRLARSLIALVVCVFALLPFKTEITKIYVAPYRQMWRKLFVDHVQHLEAEAKEQGDNLHILRKQSLEFIRTWKDDILAGRYPESESHKIRDIGSFRVPYYLVSLSGLADFWTFMAASLLFSLIIASPYVVYQIWAFVAAGLYRGERRVVYRYLPFGFGLLAAGVLFGYFVVVPYGFYYLVKIMNFGDVQPMISVSQYFSLLFTMTAALGLVFQLPILMMALTKVGIVTHQGWKKNWRYVILGMFVLAAVFTPPDPFTQVMMATPMIILYALGLILTGRMAKAMPSLAEKD